MCTRNELCAHLRMIKRQSLIKKKKILLPIGDTTTLSLPQSPLNHPIVSPPWYVDDESVVIVVLVASGWWVGSQSRGSAGGGRLSVKGHPLEKFFWIFLNILKNIRCFFFLVIIWSVFLNLTIEKSSNSSLFLLYRWGKIAFPHCRIALYVLILIIIGGGGILIKHILLETFTSKHIRGWCHVSCKFAQLTTIC